MTPRRILAEVVARWKLGADRWPKRFADAPPEEYPREFAELAVVIGHAEKVLAGEFAYLDTAIPSTGKKRGKIATDLSGVDWTKSNADIAALTGLCASTVSNYRGKKSGGIRSSKLSRAVNWAGVDWTKNNQVLAAELGVSIVGVNGWRKKLNKPQAFSPGDPITKKPVSDEQINSADWRNLRDVDICSRWGVSRERVRQLRLEHNKPACRFECFSKPKIGLILAAEGVRESIAGKNIKAIATILQPLVGQIRIILLREALNFAAIPFTERRERHHHKYPADAMDWRLPNIVLQKIYGAPTNVIASMRFLNAKPAPNWNIKGGFSRFFNDEKFKVALEQELLRAAAVGFNRRAGVEKYIADYKAAVDNRYARLHPQ